MLVRAHAIAASLLTSLLIAGIAEAATRNVTVAPGAAHAFQDALSGTSTSTIAVGDTIQWNWAYGGHSTTSGTCSTTCMADGLWNSGVLAAGAVYSHTFSTVGTYHYFCSVHTIYMQGTVIVENPGPAPTITAISPTSGPSGAGTAVTITGTNFIDGATLTISGLAATGVSVVNDTTITATTPAALAPGVLDDVSVTTNNPDPAFGTLTGGWLADFLDVPQSHPLHAYVEKLIRNGVTAGCGMGDYCPDDSVTRAQMAVFLLKGKHGGGYAPPTCASTVFTDVPCPGGTNVNWINQLNAEGITGGCGSGDYCPSDPVQRQQMAPFLLKAKHGSSFMPPVCSGIFQDVPCPSLFAAWIEELSNEGITGGCSVSPPLFCPSDPNTRGQMAVFLVKTFNLM
jgi:plastocyanin